VIELRISEAKAFFQATQEGRVRQGIEYQTSSTKIPKRHKTDLKEGKE